MIDIALWSDEELLNELRVALQYMALQYLSDIDGEIMTHDFMIAGEKCLGLLMEFIIHGRNSMMIKVGRFRVLFSTKGTLVKWYILSIGMEGKNIREYKAKMQNIRESKTNMQARKPRSSMFLFLKYLGVVAYGIFLGRLIWLIAR